jgi:trehalose/maltose hydrolase-like predicted phosphorylase
MMGGWSLVYDEFNPENEGLCETPFSLGNGYFCTRGAADDAVKRLDLEFNFLQRWKLWKRVSSRLSKF